MSRGGRSLSRGVIRAAWFLAAMSGQAHAAEQAATPAVSRAVEVPPPAGWKPGTPLFATEGDGPEGARPQAHEASPVSASVRRTVRASAQAGGSARRPAVTPQDKARGQASQPNRPASVQATARKARSSVGAGKAVRTRTPQAAHKPARKVAASVPASTIAKTNRKATRQAASRAAPPKQPARAKGARAANPSKALRASPAQVRAKAPAPKRSRAQVNGPVTDAPVAKKGVRSSRPGKPNPGAAQQAKHSLRRSG
jgi:hypothetical protein